MLSRQICKSLDRIRKKTLNKSLGYEEIIGRLIIAGIGIGSIAGLGTVIMFDREMKDNEFGRLVPKIGFRMLLGGIAGGVTGLMIVPISVCVITTIPVYYFNQKF